MKKFLLVLSMVLVSFALFSCGNSDSEKVTSAQWNAAFDKVASKLDREQANPTTNILSKADDDNKIDVIEITLKRNDDLQIDKATILVGGAYYLEHTKDGRSYTAKSKEDGTLDKFVYFDKDPVDEAFVPGVWAEYFQDGVYYAKATNKEDDEDFKAANWGKLDDLIEGGDDEGSRDSLLDYINKIKAQAPTDFDTLKDGAYVIDGSKFAEGMGELSDEVTLKSVEVKFDKDGDDIVLSETKFILSVDNKEIDPVEMSFDYKKYDISSNKYWPAFTKPADTPVEDPADDPTGGDDEGGAEEGGTGTDG